LYARVGATSTSAFQFMGDRCDRMVARVMERLQELLREEPTQLV